VSIQIGLDSGDEYGLLEFLEDFGLREDFGESADEFYPFFEDFSELVEWRDQIEFLGREVKRLLA